MNNKYWTEEEEPTWKQIALSYAVEAAFWIIIISAIVLTV
jgi:hypothetical protein